MRRALALSAWWTRGCLEVCLTLGAVCSAQGQTERPQHIILPPAFGATPLSTVIEAQAKYVAAYGDYLESVATARKIHAEAFAIEIKNAVDFVDAYFKSRELNREWRRKEEKNHYWDTVQRQQKLRKERMEKYFQEVAKGNPAAELNWLLAELSGPTTAIQYLAGRRSLREFDQKLPQEDREQIWLTDGGKSGQELIFSLAEGQSLKTPWPFALRGPEFDAARAEFEAARDNAENEFRNDKEKKVSTETAERLMTAVNQMFVHLEEVYPEGQRTQDTAEFLRYNAARHYLRSLAGQVHRVCSTNDPAFVTGSSRFDGETVMDLLQYLYQRGLAFAKPQPGGERVYRNLLANVRNIYLVLGSETEQREPARDAPKP